MRREPPLQNGIYVVGSEQKACIIAVPTKRNGSYNSQLYKIQNYFFAAVVAHASSKIIRQSFIDLALEGLTADLLPNLFLLLRKTIFQGYGGQEK